ncbi:MAG TPA: ABC transporter permease [Thermomicrobiales bacterium]|nr:ABC transporter permease [Thermomicrobiales bacterium]
MSMHALPDVTGAVPLPDLARERFGGAASGSPALRWLRRFGAHPRMTIGGAIIVIVSLLALLAPWIAQNPPEVQNPLMRLAPPSSESGYWLGGDSFGRDTFSRLVYAGRVSLSVGLLSMLITVVVGVAVGAIAGYYGGWADRILMRITDVVLVIPTFFLLILTVATFGRSIGLLIVVIGLTSWPINAKVVRGEIMRLRNRDYVTASRVTGASDGWIVVRHLLPQLIPIVIASATIRVANNILIESGLSYLGLGVQPPTPTWGNMVTEGADFMRQAWWLVGIPGAAIFIVVLAFNLFGEGLRDFLDPRTRKGAA